MNKNTRLQIMIGKLLAVGMVAGTLLVGCGGGGGGPAATVGGVYISAGVSPSSTAGQYSGVVSLYVDNPSGASIANATVTMNGVPLTYNSGLNYYGNNSIPTVVSGNVTLSVTANGATYTATQIPFSWTPTITVQNPFNVNSPNVISWTRPAVSGLNYDVRIDDSSNIVYSTPSTSATNFTVPTNTLVAGSYTATVEAFQIGPQIANAATGSNFSYSASATTSSFNAQ